MKVCKQCNKDENTTKFWKYKKNLCSECAAYKQKNDRLRKGKTSRINKNRKNLQDFTFGYLKVIEEHGRDSTNELTWECLCICGNKTIVSTRSLITGNTKSCGCKREKTKNLSPVWKGHEEISGYFFYCIKKSAIKRNIEFNITIEDIWNLYILQNKKCKLSGLDICFPEKAREKGTASLDRIDSSKGYIKDNLQWLHKDINLMKNSLTQNNFVNYCKLITKYIGDN